MFLLEVACYETGGNGNEGAVSAAATVKDV